MNLHPDNEKYKSKLKFYKTKISEEKEKARIAAERKKGEKNEICLFGA